MNNIINLKALLLSFVFAALLAVPSTAQHSDDFFRVDDGWTNRDIDPIAITTTMNAQNFGNYAPVGSGLLILTAIGAGYAVARRRRSLRKNTTLLLALAMLLGLTQCKKKIVETYTSDGKVEITFSPKQSRTNILATGEVQWLNTDVLHVYSSEEGYLGALTYESGDKSIDHATFSGSITPWTDGATLYFYYLGNRTPEAGKSLKINFSDQSDANTLSEIAAKYHVSCYQVASADAIVRSFSGTMENMMALAVFNTSGFGSGNVKIYSETEGFRNQIIISSTGELSYGVAGVNSSTDFQTGHIVIGPAASKSYVALLPSSGSLRMKFTSQSKTGQDVQDRTIEANQYILADYNSGDPIGVSISASNVPNTDKYVDIAVVSEKLFSVSSTKQVKFAKGNLVYDQGRFKMHNQQYNIVFAGTGSVVSNVYRVNGTFDLFKWGTSGWDNGNYYYMPYSHSKDRIDTEPGYSDGYASDYGFGPKSSTNYDIDLTGDPYAKSDWGVYQFGMNTGVDWRVLTNTEFGYLLFNRSASTIGEVANARFIKAQVHSRKGVIIFPDEFSTPGGVTLDENKINTKNAEFTSFTNEQWTALENAGVVFLPYSGELNTTYIGSQDAFGMYWTSTSATKSDYATYYHMYAYKMEVNNANLEMQWSERGRSVGLSVRLVRDAN